MRNKEKNNAIHDLSKTEPLGKKKISSQLVLALESVISHPEVDARGSNKKRYVLSKTQGQLSS
jgi:hypothetical protein